MLCDKQGKVNKKRKFLFHSKVLLAAVKEEVRTECQPSFFINIFYHFLLNITYMTYIYITEQVQHMVGCWQTVSKRNKEIQSYVCNDALYTIDKRKKGL